MLSAVLVLWGGLALASPVDGVDVDEGDTVTVGLDLEVEVESGDSLPVVGVPVEVFVFERGGHVGVGEVCGPFAGRSEGTTRGTIDEHMRNALDHEFVEVTGGVVDSTGSVEATRSPEPIRLWRMGEDGTWRTTLAHS